MTTHHMFGTPEYSSWASMKARCLNENNSRYHRYGSRGIRICDRWLSFEGFYADMGPRPPGFSLDRIDNDGHYEPGNCAWIPMRDQGRKTCRIRNLTHNGVTRSIAEWARHLGVKPHAISMRLNKYGWTVEKALSTGGEL